MKIKNKIFILVVLTFFIISNSFYAGENEKPKDRPSVALVLSGGGAKGFAHIAVLEVIEELGIPIDMVIGNSIGSVIGGLYCVGYSTEEMLDVIESVNWAKLFQDTPISSFENILGNKGTLHSPFSFKLKKNLSLETGGGLSTGQNVYMLFKKLTSKIPSYVEFDSLYIPFRAAAVNLLTGELDLIKEGDLAEAIRSSMSIPAVFQPFPVDKKLYVDGFVRNNTPIQSAVDMGYDIIIAVDLGDEMIENSAELDSKTLSTVTQVLTIFMYSSNNSQFTKADVVLHPKQDNFTMFDFQKSMEIYQQAVKEKEKYRKALSFVKDQIYPNQEKEIKQKDTELKLTDRNEITEFSFTPIKTEKDKSYGFYNTLSNIVVDQIEVYGAVNTDLSFIRTFFDEEIKGKELTPELLDLFVNSIYAIGNYSFVIPRIDTRYEQNRIELYLHKVDSANWLIIPNATFEGTLADSSISKLSFGLDIQFRGLTGTGSIFSASLNAINDFGAGLMYLQPIGHHTYLELFADTKIEQEFITSGFSAKQINSNRLSFADTGFLIGVRFNNKHRMQTGGAIYWSDSSQINVPQIAEQQKKYPNVKAKTSAPLNISYTFDTLDYPVFPSKGLYVKLDDTGVFPLFGTDTPLAFNLCRIEFAALVPVSDKFSFGFNMFAGSDITRQLQKIPSLIPLYGYALGDRTFFPQFSGKAQYGTHKGAAQVLFQYQPWQNLTILGGQLFISLSGSLGEVAMDYTDFSVKGIQWNASLNTGVRINKGFSIMCRFGAGTVNGRVLPYLSMDFGGIRY